MIITIKVIMVLFIIAGAAYTVWDEIKAGPPWRQLETETETKPDPAALASIAANNRQIEFCDKQLEILRRMEKDAETAYNLASDAVKDDTEKNQYCMVVSQKLVLKHIRERDKAANNLLTARNKINNLELKKVKLQAAG